MRDSAAVTFQFTETTTESENGQSTKISKRTRNRNYWKNCNRIIKLTGFRIMVIVKAVNEVDNEFPSLPSTYAIPRSPHRAMAGRY